MRALGACVAILLACAVVYCHSHTSNEESKHEAQGRNRVKEKHTSSGGCYVGNTHIANNTTKNLVDPCSEAKCLNGGVTFTNCTEDHDNTGHRGGNQNGEFPHCCPKKQPGAVGKPAAGRDPEPLPDQANSHRTGYGPAPSEPK